VLQNPDIVLVHYLNVPAIEDCGKPCGPILCSINTDKKEWAKWTKEELIGQLKPMFHGIKWTCSNGNSSTGFSVEQLVQQILDSHQTKPPPRTHNCLCTGTLGNGSDCISCHCDVLSPSQEGSALSVHIFFTHVPLSQGSVSQISKSLPNFHRTPSHRTESGGSYECDPVDCNTSKPASAGCSTLDTIAVLAMYSPPETPVYCYRSARRALPLSCPARPLSAPFCVGTEMSCCPLEPVAQRLDNTALHSVKQISDHYDNSQCVVQAFPIRDGTHTECISQLRESFCYIPRAVSLYPCSVLSVVHFHLGNCSMIQDQRSSVHLQNRNLPPGCVNSERERHPGPSDSQTSERYGLAGRQGDSQAQDSSVSVDRTVDSEFLQDELASTVHLSPLLMGCTSFSPKNWSYRVPRMSVTLTNKWKRALRHSCDQSCIPVSLFSPHCLCKCPQNHIKHPVLEQLTVMQGALTAFIRWNLTAELSLWSAVGVSDQWVPCVSDNQFRMSILERLEQMERRMAEMSGHHQQGCMSGQGPAGSSFESRVVVVCEKMMSRACWAKSKHLIHSKTFRGMTLLHLAAAQGYATLIQTLIKWRSKHADSIDLELEVDPLNVDHFSCTPLMWACALGHMEAAVVLYKWDRRALAIPDSLGRLPLSIARSRGHTKLADCLEQLQRDEQQQPPSALPPAPRLAFSPAPDTPAPDSWMVAWGSDTVAAAPGQKGGGAGATTNPSPGPAGQGHVCAAQPGAAAAPQAVRQPQGSALRQPLPGQEPGGGGGRQQRGAPPPQGVGIRHVNMMTLAEHIIEATPERIKRENFVAVETTPLDSAGVSNTMSWLASYLGDVEHLPSVIHLREGPFEKPSLPSPADWTDFLSASNSKVERDLAQLTLSDPEQRELYEAARLVQTAFRKYKGRPLREQQEVAAAVIQRCYRKYKQYALYKKMTQAAILIQSKFRSYHEQKKFQQSRRAAVLIQQYYRSYKEFGRLRPHRRAAAAALVQHKLRSSLLTKKQDQAARKIMRFLRRCRHSPLMDHRLFKRSERIEKGQGT
uniref:Calmodulin binding transcription activator 1a n=1 Tax=Lepisosteus oculatus TaxID=7918 RepID=W5M473_LEPOC